MVIELKLKLSLKFDMSRAAAISIFEAAVQAVLPNHLVQQHIHWDGNVLQLGKQQLQKAALGKVLVIAAGKAAALMAQTAAIILQDLLTDGIAVTKYEHALPLNKIKLIEAGHPLPDDNSLQAGKAVRALLNNLSPNDVVICLISGGASALLADVPDGISLADMQTTFQLLLNSGATIQQMNVVRKHLSQLKGGWLAVQAQPAKLFSFLLSDVVGDAMDSIASGPTVPDPSTFADAWQTLRQFNIENKIPVLVRQYLLAGLSGAVPETPKAHHPAFANVVNAVIGSNQIALAAAKAKAEALGYETTIVTNTQTGEAKEVAASFVKNLKASQATKPCCWLMGGETTVTLKGNGKGGRNQEFVLAACNFIRAQDKITILSCGTDGTDGPTDAAGAVADAKTIATAKAKQLMVDAFLQNNDAYHFFEQVGGLIKTGATQTNVMDVAIGLKT
jgi:glycerate 2-kinase